jgi:hypothetical protein
MSTLRLRALVRRRSSKRRKHRISPSLPHPQTPPRELAPAFCPSHARTSASATREHADNDHALNRTTPLLPRKTTPDIDVPSSWQPCPQPQNSRRKLRGYEGQGHDPSCPAYGSALAQMHITPELDHAHVSPLHPRGSRTRSVRRGARSRHLSFTRHEEDEKTVDSTTHRARRRLLEGTYFRRGAPRLSPVPLFTPLSRKPKINK